MEGMDEVVMAGPDVGAQAGAAASSSPGAGWQPAAAAAEAAGPTALAAQVRHCERRWATDAYRTAIGEIDANRVSLVGIGGYARNAALLYGDMCALGYGQPGCVPNLAEAERWYAVLSVCMSCPLPLRLAHVACYMLATVSLFVLRQFHTWIRNAIRE